MKLSREFTKRETVLILILTAIVLVFVYYWFVYTPLQDEAAGYDTTAVEDQIMVEQARAVRIANMQSEMDENKKLSLGEIAEYNNLKNEMSELNTIFASASSYHVSFEDPVASGNIVRRNINVTFSAESYDKAESMIEAIYGCKYRCLIGDVNMNPSGSGDVLQEGEVDVSLTVTFYETIYNATDTSGLIFEDTESEETVTEE